jgi:Mn-dependent DtxR family transcriptional regulator
MYSKDLLEILFKHPYTKINQVARELDVHYNTARDYLEKLSKDDLVKKMPIGRANFYVNEPLFNLFVNQS